MIDDYFLDVFPWYHDIADVFEYLLGIFVCNEVWCEQFMIEVSALLFSLIRAIDNLKAVLQEYSTCLVHRHYLAHILSIISNGYDNNFINDLVNHCLRLRLQNFMRGLSASQINGCLLFCHI